ncbi:MAG: hypothetical protein SGCHY_004283 [Lobulomycetales sp.]
MRPGPAAAATATTPAAKPSRESLDRLSMLETRTKSLEGSLKRKAIDYDSLSSNADSLQQKLSSARERVQKLELDREFFLSRQQELQERLESVEKEKAAQILALQTTINTQAAQLGKLRDENLDLESSVRDEQSRNTLEKSQQEIKVTSLARKVESLTQMLESANAKLADRSSLQPVPPPSQALQTQQTQPQQLDLAQANDTLTRQLTTQLAQIKSLQSRLSRLKEENAYLNSTSSNTLRLLEERDAAQRQTAALESKYKPLLERLEQENLDYESERARWAALLDKDDQLSRPGEIIRSLHQARVGNAVLAEERDRLSLACSELQRDYDLKTLMLESLEKKHDIALKSAQDASAALARSEKNAKLARQECAYLKSLLDSCEIPAVTSPVGSAAAPVLHVGGELQDRLTQLEELLTKYRTRITEYEQEIRTMQQQQQSSVPGATSAPQQPAESKSAQEALKQRNSELMSRVQELTVQHDYVKRNAAALEFEISALKKHERQVSIRILELKDNPEARILGDRNKKLKLLQKENESLLAARISDGGDTRAAQVVPLETYNRVKFERDSRASELSSLETRMQRLKSVCMDRITRVREVVLNVFGYRLDMQQQAPGAGGTVRIGSVFNVPGKWEANFILQDTEDEGNSSGIQGEMKLELCKADTAGGGRELLNTKLQECQGDWAYFLAWCTMQGKEMAK